MISLHRRNIEFDEPPDTQEGIFVSKSHIFLFGDMKETIKVWWHMTRKDNMMDWIGLFNSDDSSFYLDQKSLRRQNSPIFFSVSPKNLLHATHIYFGYIDGMTGKMLARSTTIEICLRANFVVHEITRDLNCLNSRVWIMADEKEVEIPEKMVRDIKLNFAWQEVQISLCSPASNAAFSCPSSSSSSSSSSTATSAGFPRFRHNFHAHQLQNECSRSIDDRGDYRIDIIYSIEPICDASNSMESSIPSTSSSMSTGLSGDSVEQISRQFPRWQMCLDAKGRVFYVNHETKETSWTNPEKNLPRKGSSRAPLLIGTPKPSRRSYERSNEAFITPRRTIALNQKNGNEGNVREEMAAFFQKSDFVVLLHENQKALDIYNSSSVVRHAVQRIQSHLDLPQKFEKNPKFVMFFNSFADQSEPMPKGWDAIEGDTPIFVNHSSKITSFLDPRVRKLESKESRRGRSAPSRRSRQLDNNGNHILLNKTEEILQVADQKLPHIADRIRKKMRLVERFGELAIASLANDLDLSLAVSMLEIEDENRNPRIDENITTFFGILQRAKYGKGPGKLTWKFSRDNLLEDASKQILQIDIFCLKKSRLHISFDDEIALDYGGPSREFFILLSRELFHPKHGFFEYYGTDYYLQLSPKSCEIGANRRWLELCGRVLALAIIHKCLIDVFFTNTFYKLLLNRKANLEDFETIDTEFYNSMKWILENDVDGLDMRFVFTDVNCENQVEDVELLPDGENHVVTNNNKTEFVEMMCQKQAMKGISKNSKILTRSFHQILDPEILSCLQADELRMVLSGSMELDLYDWRMNTVYKGGYFDSHVVIEWFWEIVEKMSNFERFNLLLFVTGSSSVPFEGFSALRGTNGSNKFCIEKWGDEASLPRAHTCFNRLQLPSYQTKHIMKAKLSKAIENGMNYSIE
ncbi:unnamed protein product [Caenorhabditis bovis]|uniref:HECT-type E3 ubiquitin transferase n=1 Tax=Caenorhabditis bovis TaxID=2654633 RepID=A0A8S1EMR2_9PELO|nr:unnamed protein product [Caenorhabditis bovis]